MSTILNQSEYDNGQVLTDVKLQTINEQLFGDSLPNSAAEPHVNTDGQQDIGTQTNRWRHGNFSNEVRTGNSPSIGSGGFLAGSDGANGGLTCLDLSTGGGSVRYFRQNNLGYFSRGDFISSSTSFRGQAMSGSGQIAHSVIDAAPSFIEAYNLKGRIRAYNTPKAGALLDHALGAVLNSFGFSSINFINLGGGFRGVRCTFDANAAPPDVNYYVTSASDDIAGGTDISGALIVNKTTARIDFGTESGRDSRFASFLIYWEGV
jgi:hypothetical protein